ncbi:MAG: ATP-binding protein [Pirellulales bacterium]|nr:ATP-binding protein [Pirellulales bacterium]
MQDFEKLGLFYLGRVFDVDQKSASDELLLYDANDLVTHAVCIGMTGSGKTGLCLSLLEEAAIDGVPCLAIDPKGDIGNLLLTFPGLSGQEFTPWINADDARREGVTPQQLGDREAEKWRKGLAEWGEDGARIERLRAAAEIRLFTPGSTAGLPLSILPSFSVPPVAIQADAELFGELVQSAARSLLALLGLHDDTGRSREQILLSNILESEWRENKSIALGDLVRLIQNPPIERVGVMELEAFFPAKERFEMALTLNNLVAAPGFEAWLEGEPLDIQSLLYSPDGKPRVAIVSIAHLNDDERMFVVTLLLQQLVAWMRAQQGTSSLRAILYMDEIAGYLPPTANPPSKASFLTLLKQGRAFGLGALLATQNPVDLDYKALSNAGTWFLGRLQTERDKARVLEGLETVAASSSTGFDRQRMDHLLASLPKRVFLMNNVHDSGPVTFQVRWAMSYLRGPLTRDEMRRLCDPQRPDSGGEAPGRLANQARVSTTAAPSDGSHASRPVLPPKIPQIFLTPREAHAEQKVVYQGSIVGVCDLHFRSDKEQVDSVRTETGLLVANEGGLSADWEWQDAPWGDERFVSGPIAGASYMALPAAALDTKNYTAWKRSLVDAAYRERKLQLLKNSELEVTQKPNEPERDFRVRVNQAAREVRDAKIAKLREQYDKKLSALNEKLRRAEAAVEQQIGQQSQQKLQSWMSAGATLLGALLGRRALSYTNVSRAERTVRNFGRGSKEAQDVERAKAIEAAVEADIAKLQQALTDETAQIQAEPERLAAMMETILVASKKSEIAVRRLSLLWMPMAVDAAGALRPAW